ncbi:MAG: hypothetical protein L6R37_000845 [Teloschistes peruensis]|nr:MAG: hypothetical protein L6R37_000845 [Teloschistes peruensis]
MSNSNGYNNYSPYFRQPTGPGEPGHNSYQNTAHTTAQYPSQVYSSTTQINQNQPLSAYAPQQKQQQQQQQASFSPNASTVDRSSASHDRHGDRSTAGQYQDAREGYGFTARSSNDTTTLGNLAHASTLGDSSRSSAGTRENASLQQIIDYNRSRGSYGYGGSIAYDTAATGYNYSHERSDSRGTAVSGDGHARGPPSSPTQIQTQKAAQDQPSHYTTTAGYGNSIPKHSTSQGAPYTTNSTRSYPAHSTEQIQRSQQYCSQPGRPALNAQSSRPSQQASQSSTLPTHRTNPATGVRPMQRPEQTQARISPLPDSAGQVSSASPAPAQEKRHYYSTPTPSNSHVRQQSSSVPSSGAQQISGHSNTQTSVSPEDQAPKTVDPSHVFNHVKFQRRQAAAAAEAAAAAAETAAMNKAAEAAKKAAEVEETRKATEAATALKRVSEREKMEADMRLMIEKMRDYKSRDPSNFSEIWEQVKKTQPAGTLSAVLPLSVKDIIVPTSSVPISNLVDDKYTNRTMTTEKEGLPDLGESPTQRRKPKSTGLQEKSVSPAKATGVSRPSSQKFQTIPTFALTKAVNLDRQVVYTSGAGPEPRNQPSNHTPTPPSASSSGPPAPSAPVQAPSIHVQAPPIHVQAPPVHAYGNAFWPVHKRWDLAVAARNTLLRHPRNANKAKDISAEQILGLLNQNPSFEQLCRMIEAKSFVLERKHFARSLLDAIPDGEAGLRQKHQNAVPPPQPPPAPVAQMTPPQPPTAEEKMPLTKQEMARKRMIAEIVELSDDDDADLLPPPHKFPRPEGPTIPSQKKYPQGPHPLQSQPFQQPAVNFEDIVRPIDKRKNRARTIYNPKTIVRDVLLAAGKHPTMQPLNYHLENLRDTFKHVNDLSDLSTFRWDLVDPGEPVVAATVERRIVGITDGDGNEADNEDVQGPGSQTVPRTDVDVADTAPKLSGVPHGSTPRQPVATPTSTGTASSGSTSTVKKRGRPPRTKNKHPQPDSITRPRLNTTPARPSGLRNIVSSSGGIAVIIPSPRTVQQTSPVYRVYKCKWENCPAELHNLETLKKHVLKHGEKYAEEGGAIPCLWKGCGQATATTKDEETMDVDMLSQPLEFGTYTIWAKHMSTRHIMDDAWRLGDGPNNRSDSEISDHVSDSAKRQVDPIVRSNGYARPDPLHSIGKPTKAYHKARGITTELGKAKPFTEACEGRKKRFGPGMDGVRVTLVRDKKRALLKDEDLDMR